MAAEKQSISLEDVEIYYNDTLVGGSQSLNLTYTQENRQVPEGGNKHKREISDGAIEITGTVEQLFLDVDTLKTMHDFETGANAYFDIVAKTKNKSPERKLLIKDAKFKGFTIDIALADDSKMSREFDALRVIPQ